MLTDTGVYSTHRRDGSNTVDFEEYAIALAVFMKGSFEEKLKCTH